MKRIFVFFFLSIVATAAYAQTKTVVYFNTGQSVLLPRAQRTLDSLAAALQKKGSYRLTINGYCDSAGRHPGNVVLGRQRAGMVFDYLYHHGISGDSMVRNSFAESDPVARGWDAGSMAKNRRVEIFVSRAFAGAAGFDAATPVASLKIGQRLVIQDLNFVNNEPVLLPESVPVIKMLLKYMEDNPGLEIKLSGHVCCTDDMLLSVERAKFVYDYLERNGIDADRMSYAGFSNHMPLAPNDMTDPEAAKVNRRVEIVIVKK